MNVINYFLMMIMLMLSVVSAAFYQPGNIPLTVSCYNEGAPCDSGSCTIAKLYSNKDGVILLNQSMTNIGGNVFQHNISLNTLGDYNYDVYCEDGANSNVVTGSFEVNNSGEKRDMRNMMFIFLFFIFISICLLVFFFSFGRYLAATIMLPVVSSLFAGFFFVIYWNTIIFSNIAFTMYIISVIIAVAFLLFAIYEIIYELLTMLNKRRKSTFEDTL